MTTLNKLSIPQLIARLNSLGVEWIGSTTRKAPLIDMLNRFAYNAELLHNQKQADLTAKGLLRGDYYPISNLIALLHQWGLTATSDEVADPHTLQQRVLEIARQKYPPVDQVLEDKPAKGSQHEPICESIMRGVSQPVTDEILPSLDKVLSISRDELLDSHPLFLLECHKVMGTYHPGISKRLGVPELIRQLIPTIAGMRRRSERDLAFDPTGCQYVYESKTGFQFKIAEDMWETPTKPLYHALVLQDLKQRGFYEPDCVTDALHGLYLVCDLADAPKVYLKPGDRVTLRQGCNPITSFTRDYDWFSPGAAGYIEEVTPSECIIKAVRGGKYVKFKADPKDLMTLAQG